MEQERLYEYELVDINFGQEYGLPEDDEDHVCEDGQIQEASQHEIEYDADGIPMGHSKVEIKMREKVIKDFYAAWISEHQEKMVWNINLSSFILVKYLSINETYNKAARTYVSTKAVFMLTEILENAIFVDEQPVKTDNKNQKSFTKMLLMRYGKIKLTVGYQAATQENVQYCITASQLSRRKIT